MTTTESRPPVSPGEAAPDFTLPAVDRNEMVSLADYRGRSPVFLALFIGLWCPFCRRQIAQLGTTEGKLKALGVETLCVVATPAENARLYFKFRPTRMRLAADASRLDGLLAGAELEVAGGTSLFRLVSTPAAAGLFDRLGRAGIFVRRFAEQPTWLRFGLPGDGAASQRLTAALTGFHAPADGKSK